MERSIASVHAKAVQMLPFTEAVVVVDDDPLPFGSASSISTYLDLVLIRCSRADILQRALAQKVSGTLGRGEGNIISLLGITTALNHVCEDGVVNRIALHFDVSVGNGETTLCSGCRWLLHHVSIDDWEISDPADLLDNRKCTASHCC